MDAHLFRRLCDALIPLLTGARLEKIRAPAPGLVCLSLYARRRIHLFLQYGRDPFLFCAPRLPAASAEPSAHIMLLRKHTQGRHIRAATADALERRLYLLFGGPSPPAKDLPAAGLSRHEGSRQAVWLLLDARLGPSVEFFAYPPPAVEISFPPEEKLAEALQNPRAHPALTPALRRTLPLLDAPEARALLADLAAGGGDVFVYGEGEELSAWPLPEALRRGRAERVFEDAPAAATLVGNVRVFGGIEAAERRAALLPWERKIRRLCRLLKKLDEDETRFQVLTARREEGLFLQERLWRMPADARPADFSPGKELLTPPDPRHNAREHMARLFHDAARGRRGLAALVTRRETVRRELEEAENALRSGLPVPGPARKRTKNAAEAKTGAPNKTLPKNVRAFVSGDGLLLLCGRDAAGNLALLRLARPDDLWLHAEGGPGAHVLVRSGRSEIPERSLHEAAQLAVAKSVWRGSARARVICARARFVRPVKGAPPGTVRVEKTECVRDIAPDADCVARIARV